ncbi:MAG: Tryptophanyl-tRNA synthetase [Parcubacteria group bacterium GW2011_GWC1_39_29]|nr:MAG: Tryptophanyl-tRNA synthetase [Parcubacteria group bacterium GW2011_GWC1_39_29]
MSKKTILTGDRPTGPLHLGHYFGSLVNRIAFQDEFESYFIIADVQALTDHWEEPELVRQNVFEVACDNLAAGIDPDKSTLFIQSQIPEIAELTIFYSNLVTINTLRRNPTVKSEIAEKRLLFGDDGESVTFGFLGYPVSQAADITCVRADLVPVGADQLPMIEQTREIIEKFHRIYNCNIFPIPKAHLSNSPRILGLDGDAKMSKSLNNAIYLKDSEEDTIQKIKTAKTDSESTVSFDPKERPEISNLILLFALANSTTPEEVAKDLVNVNYSTFKQKLADDLNKFLKSLRERRVEIASNPKKVMDILENGRIKTQKKAAETMRLVREAMKINY